MMFSEKQIKTLAAWAVYDDAIQEAPILVQIATLWKANESAIREQHRYKNKRIYACPSHISFDEIAEAHRVSAIAVLKLAIAFEQSAQYWSKWTISRACLTINDIKRRAIEKLPGYREAVIS